MAGDVKDRPDGWERPSRGMAFGEVRGESLVEELALDIAVNQTRAQRRRVDDERSRTS